MDYIIVREVDNGWIIERNQIALHNEKRETLVCANGRVVVEHIARMLCGDAMVQEGSHD